MAQWAKAALVKTLVQSLAPTWWKERTTKLSAGWARKDAAPAIGLLCSLGKGETPMFFLYQECGHLPGRRKFLLRNKPWHFDLGLLSLQNWATNSHSFSHAVKVPSLEQPGVILIPATFWFSYCCCLDSDYFFPTRFLYHQCLVIDVREHRASQFLSSSTPFLL